MTDRGGREDDSYVEAVLATVETLGPGDVTTYGAIAAVVGRGGPRQVGRVMALHGDSVAWWRVVRADGSPPSCHGGSAPSLLREDGVRFLANGRVDIVNTRDPLNPTRTGMPDRRPD